MKDEEGAARHSQNFDLADGLPAGNSDDELFERAMKHRFIQILSFLLSLGLILAVIVFSPILIPLFRWYDWCQDRKRAQLMQTS